MNNKDFFRMIVPKISRMKNEIRAREPGQIVAIEIS